jgi:hypothetical protein
MTTTASASNNWVGCHPDMTDCYRTQLACSVSMTYLSGPDKYQFDSNGIPDHNAWGMAGNAATIVEQSNSFRVPRVPVLLDIDSMTPAGQGAIAFAKNGVSIFGPYNSGCCDATFQEIQSMDYCLGHPANGNYHYHYFSKNTEGGAGCLNSCAAGEVSDLVGVAKDGFPIYGPMQWWSPSEEKIYLDATACGDCELRQIREYQTDVCGGVEVADGSAEDGTTYRYIVTGSFPFNLQCYRGDISLSRTPAGDGWREFTVNNSCGINNTADGTCELMNEEFLQALGCSPGNCPYNPNSLRKLNFWQRSKTHVVDDVYHQCDGCTV